MFKYRFVRVRISILTSKIIFGIWRPLEADPGGQPGMPSCMSKYRFNRVRISILSSKIMSGTLRPLILEN